MLLMIDFKSVIIHLMSLDVTYPGDPSIDKAR